MQAALIVDGKVKQLDLTMVEISAAKREAGWRIVDDSVVPGMILQEDDTFAAPEVAPEPRRVGTPREFLHLFTEDEKAAFFGAVGQNIQLAIWWAEASTGDFSLDHPSVEAGLDDLVQAGLITVDRRAEIMATDFDQT